MKIKDLLGDQKMTMSPQLEPIMAKAFKEVFPFGFESCEINHWTESKIVNHFINLDLDDKDVEEVIKLTARFSKIWSFS